jgi:hypothetical protein
MIAVISALEMLLEIGHPFELGRGSSRRDPDGRIREVVNGTIICPGISRSKWKTISASSAPYGESPILKESLSGGSIQDGQYCDRRVPVGDEREGEDRRSVDPVCGHGRSVSRRDNAGHTV